MEETLNKNIAKNIRLKQQISEIMEKYKKKKENIEILREKQKEREEELKQESLEKQKAEEAAKCLSEQDASSFSPHNSALITPIKRIPEERGENTSIGKSETHKHTYNTNGKEKSKHSDSKEQEEADKEEKDVNSPSSIPTEEIKTLPTTQKHVFALKGDSHQNTYPPNTDQQPFNVASSQHHQHSPDMSEGTAHYVSPPLQPNIRNQQTEKNAGGPSFQSKDRVFPSKP